jgi:hypothetical protein
VRTHIPIFTSSKWPPALMATGVNVVGFSAHDFLREKGGFGLLEPSFVLWTVDILVDADSKQEPEKKRREGRINLMLSLCPCPLNLVSKNVSRLRRTDKQATLRMQ